MPSAARSAVAPAYLLACLLLGGSAQGVWQNALLQLAGLGIIVWAASATAQDPLPKGAKPLLLLLAGAAVIVLLQLIPLSSAIWAHGSRVKIAEGYRILGQAVPPLPISMTPYESMSTLLCVIPPLAIFCAVVRLRAYHPSWLAAALLAGAVAGIMLGAVQVASASGEPRWYLYPQTNIGAGVGFFANANHMADLLVIAVPFVAAIAASGRTRNIQHYSGLLAILAGVVLVLVVGIALNGSLAGYALVLPVLAASALIIMPAGNRFRPWVGMLAALCAVASVAAIASSSIGGTKVGQDASTSVQSRQQILATTSQAIADYMPWGSGLGSFVKVYRLYESPDRVTSEYVIHAHNDYAELTLELGLAGLVLIVLFVVWWFAAARSVWRAGAAGPYARAAAVASAAMLIHSLVDFPLRTAALSTAFAMCLALLVERRVPQRQEPNELRPTRHVVIR